MIQQSKQKGVALFMTLLIVSIATLIASEIWFKNHLDISRQYNNRASTQAQHYAQGMILWAKDVLRIDHEESANKDTNSDIWLQEISGIPVQDAVISGQLTDLSSKFNLNNLWINGTVHQNSLGLFQRLLTNMKLDVGIADKVIDWIDPDNQPRTNGAEDILYSTRKPYLKTAGQHLTHISELRLIDGVSEDIYNRLKTYVTVLPINTSQPTKINLNTTSLLILKSIDDNILINEARVLFSEGNASFNSLEEFQEQGAVQGVFRYDDRNGTAASVKIEFLKENFDVKSTWIHAKSQVLIENAVYQRFAILNRNSAIPNVVEWSQTSFE